MQPTAELTKVEQDPISTSGASIFSMSPNQAIPTEKLIRFFLTRRRLTVDHGTDREFSANLDRQASATNSGPFPGLFPS